MTDRMTRPEAVTLCRLAKAACPNQAIDEYTPDAWFELLRDLRFEDCKDALFAVTREAAYVAPADIRRGVRRRRHDRLTEFGPIVPPSEYAEDPAAELEWITDLQRRIADGTVTRGEWEAEQRALGRMGGHKVPALEGVFRSVDE